MNGILEAEKIALQSPSNVNRLSLGRARTLIGQIYFKGRMDATSYWTTALTPSQIQSLAQLGVKGFEQGLKSFWDWDNGDLDQDGFDLAKDSFNLTLAQGVQRTNINAMTALDFGYSAGSKADTFAAFQRTFASVLGANSQPEDNPDTDLHSNLLEYALCLHPGTGVFGPGGFIVEGTQANVDAVFWRRAEGLADVTYQLEGRASLPVVDSETWSILLTIPGQGTPPDGVTVNDLGNGIEEVRVQDIGNLSPLTASLGYARMTVVLDDGNLSSTAYTQVFGWREATISGGQQATYGNALTKNEVISGTIDQVSGSHVIQMTRAAGGHSMENVLDLTNKAYYIEIIAGENEGHRFDIDGAGSDTLTLAKDSDVTSGAPYNTLNTATSLPTDLAGDQFIVREHYTLDDYFPPSALTATANLGTSSDQVYLYTPNGWNVFWLREDSDGDHWASNTDLTFAGAGGTVIAPGEGLFIRPAADLTLFAVGPVRKHAFQRPLAAGYNLVAPGFPHDQSIAERGLSPQAFDGSPDPEMADQICVYDAELGAYHCYFLLKDDEDSPIVRTPRWVNTEDSFLNPADFDASVFQADGSQFYYRANAAKLDYFMPLPWCLGLIGE